MGDEICANPPDQSPIEEQAQPANMSIDRLAWLVSARPRHLTYTTLKARFRSTVEGRLTNARGRPRTSPT